MSKLWVLTISTVLFFRPGLLHSVANLFDCCVFSLFFFCLSFCLMSRSIEGGHPSCNENTKFKQQREERWFVGAEEGSGILLISLFS